MSSLINGYTVAPVSVPQCQQWKEINTALAGEFRMPLDRDPKFADIMLSLDESIKLTKGMIRETKEAIAMARKFNDEVVRPYAIEDRLMASVSIGMAFSAS